MGLAAKSRGEAGFSLIEVIVALGLFSLIAVAGFSLVSSILGVQERTDGRLQRLGDLQRALHLITSDLQQLDSASLSVDAGSVSFRRAASGGETMSVGYEAADGNLLRILSAPGSGSRRQPLVAGVSTVRWRAFLPGSGWLDAWPVVGEQPDEESPTALAIVITLDEADGSLSGELTRTVELPRGGPR